MVENETSIVEAVSESCIAEKIDFSRPSVVVKDVLLEDDARFDFSGDFSLLLTETTACRTLSSFESGEADDDECDGESREESEHEIFIDDEESMLLMSAMGLPTTFVASSDLRASKNIRKTKKSSRRKNQKVASSFDSPSSSEHMLLHQRNAHQSNDDVEFLPTCDRDSRGFEEDLPTSTDAATAFPAQSTVQELSIDTDLVNDEGGSAGLVQNSGVERLDNVHQVSTDVVNNELDGDSNHEMMVSPWVPHWDYQYGRYYFFNSITLNSTWEPPEDLDHRVSFSANKENKDMQDDSSTEACGKLGEKGMESRSSSVDQVPEESIGNLNREVNAFSWVHHWDDHYGRYYFCNSKTLETTWEPPEGLEYLACSSAVQVEDSRATEDDAETEGCSKLEGEGLELELFFSKKAVGSGEPLERQSVVESHHNELQSVLPASNDSVSKVNEALQALYPFAHLIDTNNVKSDAVGVDFDGSGKALTNRRHTKKASKMMMKIKCKDTNSSALTRSHGSNVYKYWIQRFHLFSKFSAGVKLDEEGWFSVTPEIIAKHHAARCNHGVIVDAFVGVGGNAIQFALAGHYVIAIDNDPRKIECAHHNASIYGVADRIDFLLGDFFVVSSSLQADVVFLSPPWGGPEYLNVDVYDIQTMMQPKNGMSIFSVAHAIASNIIFFLPRNVNVEQLAELSQKSTPHLTFEVERNFLNGKLKAVTAYYGLFACLG